MDASRRGDDRRQEGVTQAGGRVAIPIFLNLRPSPLVEREINVLMEQGAIQRGVVSAAMEVVHCGDVNRDSPKISNVHGAGKHVCHKVCVCIFHSTRREKVGFIENTARRHRWGG